MQYRVVRLRAGLHRGGMTSLVLLFLAGLLGGMMNALAGGGSFVTLPAMIAAGVPSVLANASSTVALLPGGLASAWAFRDGLGSVCGVGLGRMLATTLVGGVLGALLLLWTPSSLFDLALPWLLLVAAVTLWFGPRLRTLLQRRTTAGSSVVLPAQLILGIYGGYFGGAVGLMMMAVWTLFGQADAKAMSAPRTFLVSATNAIAVIAFVIAGAVRWPETAIMLVGATIGGYAGARLSRLASPGVIRTLTIVMTAIITLGFFIKTYHLTRWL
jgi:uncharacterized protein